MWLWDGTLRTVTSGSLYQEPITQGMQHAGRGRNSTGQWPQKTGVLCNAWREQGQHQAAASWNLPFGLCEAQCSQTAQRAVEKPERLMLDFLSMLKNKASD